MELFPGTDKIEPTYKNRKHIIRKEENMSRESLKVFMEKTASNSFLEEELKNAVGNKTGQEALDAFVKAGSDRGFDFTAQEVRELFEEKELNDKELESVTGGNYLSGLFEEMWRRITLPFKD